MSNRFSRAVDYIFGRNILIGAAALMLLAISGYATWHGMTDFIIGTQQDAAAAFEPREIGGLAVTNDALIVAITVALTFLMWLSLRETFGSRRSIGARLVTLPLYFFLMLWSVGFGYGFWWSLIAGPTATQEGLEVQVAAANAKATDVVEQLEAVSSSLAVVVRVSEERMALEESQGGSCGRASGAGQGPLYQARRSVRDDVANLRDSMVVGWLDPVRVNAEALNQTADALQTGIEGATVSERGAAFRASVNDIRRSVVQIAATSNAQAAIYAPQLNALAAQLDIPFGEPGFFCHDPRLASALRVAAERASLEVSDALPEAAFNEGAAGVANAVLILWENVGDYLAAIGDWWGAPETQSEGAEVAQTDDGDPITGRDLIALLAAIGVDLGLFALTVLNPPTAAPARRDSLDDTLQRMYEPSEVSIREIASIVRTSLMVAPDTTLEWVRKHFFSHLGYSYFAIPNLADCPPNTGRENKALAINQLAGVLNKMKLIQALDRPKRGYRRHIRRDLSRGYLESRWREALDAASVTEPPEGRDAEAPDFQNTVLRWWSLWLTRRVENRWWRPDFVAKAERALEIAGWSDEERGRPEVYFVYHREGLEPILTVLEKGEAAGLHDAPTAPEGSRS